MKFKMYSVVRFLGQLLLGVVIGGFGVEYLHTAAPGPAPFSHEEDGSSSSVPRTYGVTHFIVGQSPCKRVALRSSRTVTPVHAEQSGVFFSPDDDVRTQLIGLINNEQESIKIAVFVFTDAQIARALINAAARGVTVELVTDATGLRDRYSKIGDVCSAGIPVFIYDVQNGKSGLSSVMHHKFVVFGSNTVWTGSCNFTKSACESNQENAILLTGSTCAARFSHQFEQLKKRSYRWHK